MALHNISGTCRGLTTDVGFPTLNMDVEHMWRAKLGRHKREEGEEKKGGGGNRNESPRWWPIMGCCELKQEQRSSSTPEKWNALRRDATNLPTYLLPSFVLQESRGFENNWKQSDRGGGGGGGWGGGGQRRRRVAYLNTEPVSSPL